MKINTIIKVILFSSIVFSISSSCNSGNKQSSNKNTDGNIEGTAKFKKVPLKKCLLDSSTIEINGKVGQKVKYFYENDRLISVKTQDLQNGKSASEATNYEYAENGQLTTVSGIFFGEDRMVSYEYDEIGKLIAIRGIKNMGDRIFIYDTSGKIIKQETYYKGRLEGTHEFEYDEHGAPVKVILKGEGLFFGKHTEKIIRYSDAPNPFKELSIFNSTLNTFRNLGFPVDKYNKSTKSVTSIYHDIKGKISIGGKKVKKGDTIYTENIYQLNEDRYISRRVVDSTNNSGYNFFYKCIE